MSDQHTTESHDHKRVEHAEIAERRSTEQEQDLSSSILVPAYSPSSLADPLLNEHANRPVRNRLMLHAQQTWGNRAVQRLLGHQTRVIQRGTEDEPSESESRGHEVAPPGPTHGGAALGGPTPGPRLAAPPGGETVRFRDIELSTSPDFVRQQLESLIARSGQQGAEDFVRGFEADIGSGAGVEEARAEQRRAAGGTGGTMAIPTSSPEYQRGEQRVAEEERRLELRRQILPVLHEQLNALHRDMERFLREFESSATNVTRDLLNQSESRMRQEAVRYGLDVPAGAMTGGTRSEAERHRGSTEQRRHLATAAHEILSRRRLLDQAVAEQRRLQAPARRGETTVPTGNPEVRASQDRMAQLQREYDQIRFEREREFPILAAYTSEQGLQGLQSIDVRPEAQGAFLGDQLSTHLNNIAIVRAELGGRFNVWKQPRVLAATKERLRIGPRDMRNRWVDDHALEVSADEQSTRLLIALLTFALSLITMIPTAGASLGVAATVATAQTALAVASAAQVVEQSRQMRLEAAAGGTDLDRARAISEDEPSSIFWLALDVASAIVDIGQAFTAFRALAAALRTARESGDVVALARAARSQLPADAARRVMARAAGDADIVTGIGRRIEAVGAEFRHGDLAAVADRIERYCGQGMGNVVRELQSQRRIFPLTWEGLNASGLDDFRIMELTRGERGVLEPDILGFVEHMPGGRDLVFVGPNQMDLFTSTVVHEAAHTLQTGPMGNFYVEFDAYMAQRRYLQGIIQELGTDEFVPGGWRFLLGEESEAVESIATHIEQNYHYLRPDPLPEAEAAVRRVLSRARRFETAPAAGATPEAAAPAPTTAQPAGGAGGGSQSSTGRRIAVGAGLGLGLGVVTEGTRTPQGGETGSGSGGGGRPARRGTSLSPEEAVGLIGTETRESERQRRGNRPPEETSAQ